MSESSNDQEAASQGKIETCVEEEVSTKLSLSSSSPSTQSNSNNPTTGKVIRGVVLNNDENSMSGSQGDKLIDIVRKAQLKERTNVPTANSNESTDVVMTSLKEAKTSPTYI